MTFPPRLWILRSALPGLLISSAATAWCWYATGPTLGLFLGSILLITLYTPALVLAEESSGRWIAILAVAIGTSTVLGISSSFADVSASEWLRCSLILAAYALALGGISSILAAARIPAPIAAGITLFLALLWLIWPVWLSPWLTQSLADWLTPANPLLAMNSVVKHLGTWDRAPLAYRSLTVLNQDIPYRLPSSVLPALLLHLALGSAGMIASAWRVMEPTTSPVPSPQERATATGRSE